MNVKKAGSRDLTVLIAGDMYVNRQDPPSIFTLVAPVMREADLRIGNQEVAMSDRGTPTPGKGNLKSLPPAVTALTAAGFDIVNLANNHSMNYGPEALLQTMDILKQANIAFAGAGRSIAEAHKPAVVERKGTRIALLSYSSVFWPFGFAAGRESAGIAVVKVETAYKPSRRVFDQPGSPAITVTMVDPADQRMMLEDVANAKRIADVVVVSWHWGVSEGYRQLVSYQREMGRAALDAGADLVFGHHPHVPQGIELHGGKAICYSLGNFAFDNKSPHYARESILLRCHIQDKKIVRLSFLPVLINEDSQPDVVDLEKGRHIVETITELSASLGTKLTAAGNEVVIYDHT
ncbi:CapA family protein [Chloroflexota bacterium]